MKKDNVIVEVSVNWDSYHTSPKWWDVVCGYVRLNAPEALRPILETDQINKIYVQPRDAKDIQTWCEHYPGWETSQGTCLTFTTYQKVQEKAPIEEPSVEPEETSVEAKGEDDSEETVVLEIPLKTFRKILQESGNLSTEEEYRNIGSSLVQVDGDLEKIS